MMCKANNSDHSRHEVLIDRLFGIFDHLYQGKKIDKDWLCKTYSITPRTAYRDLGRLSHILEEVSLGTYVLSKHLQPNFTYSDLNQFAQWVDVARLFPTADGKALRNELQDKDKILIAGNKTLNNNLIKNTMTDIKTALNQHRVIRFNYANKSRIANPYKLINHSGIWYMAAEESGKLKSFDVNKMQRLTLEQTTFMPIAAYEEEIVQNGGIWFGERTSVTLVASKKAASYLKRRQLFPEQHISAEHSDGSITLTTRIVDAQILYRWLRYWLPEITIISPHAWQEDFNRELHASLAQILKPNQNLE